MQTTFEISTKKGETQTLHFLVYHEVTYPDITTECGGFKWRNGGGLFPQYNCKFEFPAAYRCHLLKPDAVVTGDYSYNRHDLAGFEGNPGAMTLRGQSLGEMSIDIGANPQWPGIRVNVFNTPSPKERETITALVVPKLLQFIAANKTALRAAAIAQIKARFESQIAEAHKAIDKLRAEADEVLAKLNA